MRAFGLWNAKKKKKKKGWMRITLINLIKYLEAIYTTRE